MITSFKNILVLAPHTDDGELGAGGTIAKLIDSGSKVTYAAFSTAAESVPEGFPKDILKTEVAKATKVLGIPSESLIIFDYQVRRLYYHRQEILEDLIRLRESSKFDLILIPSLKDIHQDHSVIAQEALRAFKMTSILGYELIWNNLKFDTTCFSVLSKDDLDRKVRSLSCYNSQKGKKYMSEEFIFSLARTRGIQSGNEFTECFEVIRLFL